MVHTFASWKGFVLTAVFAAGCGPRYRAVDSRQHVTVSSTPYGLALYGPAHLIDEQQVQTARLGETPLSLPVEGGGRGERRLRLRFHWNGHWRPLDAIPGSSYHIDLTGDEPVIKAYGELSDK